MKIRPAVAEDIEFIYGGEKETAIVEGSEIPEEKSEKKLISEALARGKILIAELDAKPIGFVWIEDTHKDPFGVNYELSKQEHAWVNWLYVSPKHRKEGVASALYSALEGHCKKKGISKILLDIYDHNKVSIKFHEEHGFKRRVGIWEKDL